MSKSNRRNFNRGGVNKADRPNKNKTYIIDMHGINSEGAGVGRLPDGKTVFVDGTLPGEKVSVLIIKENKSYCIGKLVEVLESSEGRCKPFCSVASKCGGCTFQHANYNEQLKMKYDVVYSALHRLGGIGEDELKSVMNDVLGMSEPFGYRNKVQYPVGAGGIGFYAKHSHRIIEHDECRIQPDICEKIKAAVKHYAEESGCSVYDEKTGNGLLRHVLVRVGTKTNELMVVLVINGEIAGEVAAGEVVTGEFGSEDAGIAADEFGSEDAGIAADEFDLLPDKELLIESLREIAGEQLKSVYCNINTENSNVIMGEKCVKLFGADCITEMIGNKVFKISPLSFFQVNTEQCKVLYDVVKDFALRALGEQKAANGEAEKQHSAENFAKADETGRYVDRRQNDGTTIVDLYCGAGTIGIYLSDLADKIIGIEVVEPAVRNAEENARLNGVENTTYICGEAESVLIGEWSGVAGKSCGDIGDWHGCADEGVADEEKRTDLMRTLQSKVDVLVVDPPRKGCDEQVLRAINNSAANSMIYVSCNPATLARDIKRLGEMSGSIWQLKAVQPVDMFPWTGHVETVVLLSRKN